MIDIRVAESESEWRGCFGTLRELRPHLTEDDFLSAVKRMQAQGFALAYTSRPIYGCVAGFRLMEMLATGKVLYVDDLITAAAHRSLGLGALMLRWLKDHARANQCQYLELDSGAARERAHRFYRREGFEGVAQHFSLPILAGQPWTEESQAKS